MLSALLAGGLSLVSGLGARQAAKSQQKRQAANDMIANAVNKQRVDEQNATNAKLGKQLLKVKEKSTETTSGTVTTQHDEYEDAAIASSQDNYSYVDTAGMMQAAEDAGFNPVTWLNAGGMQAYTQTGSRGLTTSSSRSGSTDAVTTNMTTSSTRSGMNAAAAYNLMSPESALVTASQATNIPSVAQAVGNAGTAALDVYRQDAARQQSQDFQRELLNLQLDAIQKAKANPGSTVNRTISTGTPSYSTSGGTVTRGGAASRSGGLSPEPKVGTWTNPQPLKAGDPPTSSDVLTSVGIKSNPYFPDAGGAITQRYGEGVEIIAGLGIAAGDLYWNLPEAVKENLRNSVSTKRPGAGKPGYQAPYERTWDWIQRNIGEQQLATDPTRAP